MLFTADGCFYNLQSSINPNPRITLAEFKIIILPVETALCHCPACVDYIRDDYATARDKEQNPHLK